MPWSARRDDRCSASEPWGVVVTDTEKLVACHRSRASAQRQVAALFASEVKEQEMTEEVQADGVEEKHYDEIDVYVPGGVTSFAELDKVRDAEYAVSDMKSTAEDFKGLINNIIWCDDVEDKATAINALSNEFAARIKGETSNVNDRYRVVDAFNGKSEDPEKEATLIDTITGAAKKWYAEAFGKEPAPEPDSDKNALMVWKQTDDRYRWLAVFSNKYRDDDRPPEILSEAAHKEFAGAVKDGDWPYPELRHWHVPGTRWGMSDWIEYDDGIGFILASGLVDEGHEKEAEALASASKKIKVSHGMLRKEMVRDAEDDTIITRYRTTEISDLPGWAAANPLTGFSIFGQEEKAMRDDIKQYLQEAGMAGERIAEVETELAGLAKQATEEREFKAQPEADPEPVVQQAKEAEPKPEAEVEKDAKAPDLNKEEIAEAIVAAVEPATAKAVQPLTETIEALEKRLADLERSDEVKVTEKAEATPAASLADLIRGRTVGSKEAGVDGRTSLAKDGPKETESPAVTPNVSGIPWIDAMVAAKPQEEVL